MGTTAQKLQRVLETKTGFKNLITEKGGVITETTTFHEYIDEARKLMEGGKVVVEEASATAVPNEGLIDKIYFNTNLSIEEVDNIINNANLDWVENQGMKAYGLVYIPDWTNGDGIKHPLSIVLMQIPLELAVHYGSDKPINMIFLSEGFNDGLIFASEADEESGVEFKGWGIFESDDPDNCNIHHPNPLEVGRNAAIQGATNTGFELSFGTCNEALKQIISITPFSAGKQPVPNSGYVESIKFNTSLSPEEVNKIITEANLDFSAGGWYYPVIIDSDNYETATNLVAILSGEKSGLGSGYAVVHNEYFIYASTSDFSGLGATFVGWNPDFNGEQTINTKAIGEVNGHPINAQNDKLVDLVYIGSEPFKAELTGTYEAVTTDITENGEVDLTTYWDNGEMPIKVNVNVPQPEGTIEINTNGVHDVSEYAEANVSIPSTDEQLEAIKTTLIDKGVATEETDTTELNGVIQEQSFLKTHLTNVGAGGMFKYLGLSYKSGNTANTTTTKPTTPMELPTLNEDDFEYCKQFNEMFQGLYAKSLPRLNTRSATDYSNMFSSAKAEEKIKDFSMFNFDNVLYAPSMFYFSEVLDDSIESIDLVMPKVKYYAGMFYDCKCNIKHINLETNSNILAYSMRQEFYSNTALESINWKLIGTNSYALSYFRLYQAFTNCTNLKTVIIDLNNKSYFDSTGSYTCNSAFSGCTNLQHVEIKNIGNTNSPYDIRLSGVHSMFKNCSSIEELPTLSLYAVDSDYYMTDIVKGCTNLKVVNFTNIRANLQLGSADEYGHLLTLDSLVNTCKECIKNTSKQKTLTVGSVNLDKLASVYVKLTDEPEEYTAFQKVPCAVCENTDEGAMLIEDYMALKNWVLA